MDSSCEDELVNVAACCHSHHQDIHALDQEELHSHRDVASGVADRDDNCHGTHAGYHHSSELDMNPGDHHNLAGGD